MKINVNFPKYLPRCCIFSFCTFSAGKKLLPIGQLTKSFGRSISGSGHPEKPRDAELQNEQKKEQILFTQSSISHWYLVLGGWISIGKWPIDHCDQLINDHCDHCGNRCTGHWTLRALLQPLWIAIHVRLWWPHHCTGVGQSTVYVYTTFFKKGLFHIWRRSTVGKS